MLKKREARRAGVSAHEFEAQPAGLGSKATRAEWPALAEPAARA